MESSLRPREFRLRVCYGNEGFCPGCPGAHGRCPPWHPPSSKPRKSTGSSKQFSKNLKEFKHPKHHATHPPHLDSRSIPFLRVSKGPGLPLTSSRAFHQCPASEPSVALRALRLSWFWRVRTLCGNQTAACTCLGQLMPENPSSRARAVFSMDRRRLGQKDVDTFWAGFRSSSGLLQA